MTFLGGVPQPVELAKHLDIVFRVASTVGPPDVRRHGTRIDGIPVQSILNAKIKNNLCRAAQLVKITTLPVLILNLFNHVCIAVKDAKKQSPSQSIK